MPTLAFPRKLRALLAVLLVVAHGLSAAARAGSPEALDELVIAHRQASTSVHRWLHAAPELLDAIAAPARGRLMHVAGEGVADAACPVLLRHDFTPVQGGSTHSLCRYHGKVLLVVNTASQCGFTYQYEGLEALYRKYRDKGLVVVGFPSNDFGGQEPGTNKDIAEFCRTKYGVQFPMYEKSSVTRIADNAFYADLLAKTGEKPRWNFHKYLVDRHGTKVRSFASGVEPDSREVVAAIEQLLAERPPANRS
jgi:glutathione peroxidase